MPNGAEDPNDPNQAHRDIAKWTKAVAWFTGALFVATIASSIFIGAQWRATVEAQDDARAQLRASVIFDHVAFGQGNPKDGKPTLYGFFVTFGNVGGTRTNSFTAWASIHYYEGVIPTNLDFSKPYNKIETHNITIPGGGERPLSPMTLAVEELTNVDAGKGVVAIWGHAEWSDIYEPTKIIPINFCDTLTPHFVDGHLAAIEPKPIKAECNTNN